MTLSRKKESGPRQWDKAVGQGSGTSDDDRDVRQGAGAREVLQGSETREAHRGVRQRAGVRGGECYKAVGQGSGARRWGVGGGGEIRQGDKTDENASGTRALDKGMLQGTGTKPWHKGARQRTGIRQ